MSEKSKATKLKEEELLQIKKELHTLYNTHDIFSKQKAFIYAELCFNQKQVESLKQRLKEVLSTDNSETNILEKLNKEIIEKDSKISELEKQIHALSILNEKTVTTEHSLKLKETFDLIMKESQSEERNKEFLNLQNKISFLKTEYEKEIENLKNELIQLKNNNSFLENKINKSEKEKEILESEINNERELHKKCSQIQTDSFLELKVKLKDSLEEKIKEITRIKPEYESFRRRNEELQRKITELNLLMQESQKNWSNYKKLEFNSKNLTDNTLIDELGNISMAYDSVSKAYNNALQKVEEYFKKVEETEKSALEIRKTLEEKIEYLKTFTKDKNDNFIIFMDKLLELNELKTKIHYLENNYKDYKKKIEQIILENELEKEKNSNLILKLNEFKRKVEEKNNEISYEKEKLFELENENKTLKKIVESIIRNGSADVFDELEKYKKVLKCITCDVNYKDTVIKKCMHVFCHECIEKRLKSRLRKCPTCGGEFHFNDVQKIYL